MSTTHVIPASRVVYRELKIHIIECASCLIDFGIGDDFMRRRREDHATFYCPNGHSNFYGGKTKEEKEIDRLERELRWETNARERLQRQAETERRRTAAYKGQVTKLQRRIANGVCPVPGCHRSFAAGRDPLLRHLNGQHETWVADHASLMTDAERELGKC